MERDEAWDEAVRVVRGDLHGLVPVRQDLTERWSEPHRGYHDLRHLDEVLDALDLLRTDGLSGHDWAACVLAAWFHDAVYAIRDAADNERLSASLARTALSDRAIGDDIVTLVVELVEASADHGTASRTGPHAAFHDADLWILAAPEPRFDEYCADVRGEYAAVADAEYADGRSAILRPFLERPWVYRTDRARRVWEGSARRNLTRELARLGALSG